MLFSRCKDTNFFDIISKLVLSLGVWRFVMYALRRTIPFSYGVFFNLRQRSFSQERSCSICTDWKKNSKRNARRGYFLYFTSSNAPVSESMMKPRTVTSLGTRGCVRIVSTVLRTLSSVSLKPSSQWFKSMPHLRMVSRVWSVTPLASISSWKWS